MHRPPRDRDLVTDASDNSYLLAALLLTVAMVAAKLLGWT